jgi:hypothetical protein
MGKRWGSYGLLDSVVVWLINVGLQVNDSRAGHDLSYPRLGVVDGGGDVFAVRVGGYTDLACYQQVVRSEVHRAQVDDLLDTRCRLQGGVDLVGLFGDGRFADDQAGGFPGQENGEGVSDGLCNKILLS